MYWETKPLSVLLATESILKKILWSTGNIQVSDAMWDKIPCLRNGISAAIKLSNTNNKQWSVVWLKSHGCDYLLKISCKHHL